MKKLMITSAVFLSSVLAIAQSKSKYIQLPGGVSYIIAHNGAAGGVKPTLGDYVETNMYLNVDGKQIYNSLQANSHKPISFLISEPQSKTDIQEVIKLMVPGDSAVILLSVDSMLKHGANRYEWMKPNTGQNAAYSVKLLNVRKMTKKK